MSVEDRSVVEAVPISLLLLVVVACATFTFYRDHRLRQSCSTVRYGGHVHILTLALSLAATDVAPSIYRKGMPIDRW